MSIGMLFWLFWILGLLVSGWGWRTTAPEHYGPVFGGGLLLWLLLALLGWKVFGFIIHG